MIDFDRKLVMRHTTLYERRRRRKKRNTKKKRKEESKYDVGVKRMTIEYR